MFDRYYYFSIVVLSDYTPRESTITLLSHNFSLSSHNRMYEGPISPLFSMIRWIALLLVLCGISTAFECPSDTILRLATNHRSKDLEAQCHREKTSNACSAEDQGKADKAWKEFEELQKRYKAAVAECVSIRKAGPSKRHALRHRHDDLLMATTDMNMISKIHRDDKLKLSARHERLRRSGRKLQRHQPDDPNDPTIDHTGHNHRRRRHEDHDPTDPTIDHSGHSHRRRRHQDHDPNDPNIDHSGHNHRVRRENDDGHDPTDPNIDHTGHNHRRRRHDDDRLPYSEPERTANSTRARRQVCMNKGKEGLDRLTNSFKEHCDRENICLPDEDLPAGKKRDEIKEIQSLRAKKYTEYLGHVSMCNA